MMDWTAGQALLSGGPVRVADLTRAGISRSSLSRWMAAGHVRRLAPGLYGLDDVPVDEHYSFLTASRQAPKAVGCLLTALEFHGLTTQLPRDVWMALEGRSHQPKIRGVNVRFHRFTGNAFHEGIEVHAVAGGTVRVYGVAKTIVDCFRLRSKVGTDVAIEALRDGLRSHKTSLDELDGLSRRLRIQTVMRPYLEMEAAS
jgi:predicted transcriptional regulator of viral defense system